MECSECSWFFHTINAISTLSLRSTFFVQKLHAACGTFAAGDAMAENKAATGSLEIPVVFRRTAGCVWRMIITECSTPVFGFCLGSLHEIAAMPHEFACHRRSSLEMSHNRSFIECSYVQLNQHFHPFPAAIFTRLKGQVLTRQAPGSPFIDESALPPDAPPGHESFLDKRLGVVGAAWVALGVSVALSTLGKYLN